MLAVFGFAIGCMGLIAVLSYLSVGRLQADAGPTDRAQAIIAVLGGLAIAVVVVALFLIRREISRTRSARAALRKANEQLEARVLERTDALARSHDAIPKSEERFHSILDRMSEGCQIIGFDWQYLYLNDSALWHGRRSRDELLGRTMMEVYPGIENTAMFGTLRRCMDERAAYRLLNEFDPGDGSPRWFDLSIQPVPEGIFVLSLDMTERKLAEAAMKESARHAQELAETLPQLIWTSQQDGRCDSISRQWSDYTGVPTEQQLGHGWLEQVHPEERAEVLASWNAALDAGAEFHLEFQLRRHDGAYRWFDLHASPYRDAESRIAKWFVSSIDVHERKRAEAAKLRTQKMEALGTLAGGIAHDFNNILLAITGNVKLALADLPDRHPAHESLLEIQTASVRAADLVRRILTFSRQQEPKRQVLQLQPIVEGALKLMRSSLPANIELRGIYAPDVPQAAADTTLVHQIIVNLASNAAHAIGAHNGLIELSLDAVYVSDDLAGTIPGLREGRYARLSVSDNGCGMDRATLERVFDPFFTTKPLGQGTGLGLSVVDGIMKSHDGAVTVYSQPGKGTTFHLYFPAAEAAAEAVPEGMQGPPGLAHGERVMYVDDEEALVLLATRMLKRLGYQVTGFSDPVQALERFRSRPQDFDVVVTDVSMPGLSGFDLVRALLAVRPDVPILMTSGYVRPEDHAAAANLGVRALILKPNSVEELGVAIDRLFRNSGAA